MTTQPAPPGRQAVTALLTSSHSHREAWAEELLDRLTPVMSALSILFLLVVLSDQIARPDSGLGIALTVLGWALWAVFAVEFIARLVVAPSTVEFLKRNWWQILFLVLPFLRVFRLIRAIRVLRSGRMLSSAVRTTRSARRLLGGRVGWLGVASGITILGSSQLLFEFSGYSSFADALHAAALATITGEPLARPDTFARILEVLLAIYSVVVFATLAGTLGAYFLDRTGREAVGAEPPTPDRGSSATDDEKLLRSVESGSVHVRSTDQLPGHPE